LVKEVSWTTQYDPGECKCLPSSPLRN